jgi:ABC-type polysaccharide/polyol phosphate export permease
MALVTAQTESGLRRRWDVFRALTVAEIRQERELSVAGILRWMVEPLSYMLVYMILLGAILNRPRADFPLFLLAALIPFRYFTECLFRSMAALRSYGSIMTNRVIPREVIPLVIVAANIPTLLLSLLLLVPFMFVYDVPLTAALGWVPVVLAILFVLTTGPCYLSALLGLYFPDLRGPVQNLVRASFFLSTGLVTLQDVPGRELPELIEANPLSSIFDSMRFPILRGRMPGELDLLYPLLVGVLLIVVGVALYRARQHEFAKEM